MITLIARLCALCAVASLMQSAMAGDGDGRDSLRLISGLLMLHLVLQGANELWGEILGERDLSRIFAALMQ